MTPGAAGRTAGLAALGALSTAALVWGSYVAASPVTQLLAVQVANAIGVIALIWLALDRRFAELGLAATLLLALALRLLAAQAQPLLEDDHYRYLWDGWRTATTLQPYHRPPADWFGDASLAPEWQAVLSGINHPDVPTIYGPVLQGLFALAYAMAPARLEAIQGVLLLVDLAVLVGLYRCGVPMRWLLALAVHPMLLREAITNAHPDGLLALGLLLACMAWRQAQPLRVGLWLGLALAVKVAALVALPLLLFRPVECRGPAGASARRWAVKVLLASAATIGFLYLPFVLAGGSDAAGLGAFAQGWRFNPLLYRFIEILVPAHAARLLAALLIATGLVVVAWIWQRRDPSSWPPLDLALLLLLLLSPVVNPWYWIWLMPLAALARRFTAFAAAACAAVSYAHSSVLSLATESPFQVAWPLTLVQLTVVLAALVADWQRSRPRSARGWAGGLGRPRHRAVGDAPVVR
jgi:hypothetical protein